MDTPEMPKLKDLKVKNAQPKEKQYKLYDEYGLHLLVKPNGTKLWQREYFFEGKGKIYSIDPASKNIKIFSNKPLK